MMRILALLLLFRGVSSAWAEEEKVRFHPMQMLVECGGADCYEHDLFFKEVEVPLQRNETLKSGYGEWKHAFEGRFYRVRIFYQDYPPKRRQFNIQVYAGSSNEERLMAKGEASFAGWAVPESVRVQTPFTGEGKQTSFGLTIQSIRLPGAPR
jgi:hypothetical protein